MYLSFNVELSTREPPSVGGTVILNTTDCDRTSLCFANFLARSVRQKKNRAQEGLPVRLNLCPVHHDQAEEGALLRQSSYTSAFSTSRVWVAADARCSVIVRQPSGAGGEALSQQQEGVTGEERASAREG